MVIFMYLAQTVLNLKLNIFSISNTKCSHNACTKKKISSEMLKEGQTIISFKQIFQNKLRSAISILAICSLRHFFIVSVYL